MSEIEHLQPVAVGCWLLELHHLLTPSVWAPQSQRRGASGCQTPVHREDGMRPGPRVEPLPVSGGCLEPLSSAALSTSDLIPNCHAVVFPTLLTNFDPDSSARLAKLLFHLLPAEQASPKATCPTRIDSALTGKPKSIQRKTASGPRPPAHGPRSPAHSPWPPYSVYPSTHPSIQNWVAGVCLWHLIVV